MRACTVLRSFPLSRRVVANVKIRIMVDGIHFDRIVLRIELGVNENWKREGPPKPLN